MRTLTGHDHMVSSVAFDTKDMLASGSLDKTIKLWNKNSGVLLRTLTGHGDWVMSVAFDANYMIYFVFIYKYFYYLSSLFLSSSSSSLSK